jgi:NAD(P)-dependent dehydrogenase (short-subunit alcohol dehydrogenase family)
MTPDLSGRHVLVLGAETEIGRAVTTAVAEAGASVVAVAATSEAEAAFGVQRLARRLSSGGRKVIAQAIDATNEAAVRVMVRQVSKELGGLDAVVANSDELSSLAYDFITVYGAKAIERGGGGSFIILKAQPLLADRKLLKGVYARDVSLAEDVEQIAHQVSVAIAGETDSG